jgi:hypothetical protein
MAVSPLRKRKFRIGREHGVAGEKPCLDVNRRSRLNGAGVGETADKAPIICKEAAGIKNLLISRFISSAFLYLLFNY